MLDEDEVVLESYWPPRADVGETRSVSSASPASAHRWQHTGRPHFPCEKNIRVLYIWFLAGM